MTNPSTNLTDKLIRLSYQLLLIVLFPLALTITLRDAVRRQGGVSFIKQRFGFGLKSIHKKPVWLHAASVGEINAVLPLLILIKKQQPMLPIMITTATATAANILKRKHPTFAHCFLPLDYKSAIKRFLGKVQPRLALIMETELWPNLFDACHQNKIPIIIINGRISNKTLHTSRWQKALYRDCLLQCSKILTRGDTDHQRFVELGAAPSTVKTIGNLKFSTTATSFNNTKPRPIQSKYVLAASTHNAEEKMICQYWQALKPQDCILVIAPRHPERRHNIIKQLKKHAFEIAVRSQNETITDKTDIYLADTMGELLYFMQFAEIVVMGGSLIPHGGQNILEPASLGKAIITGPYMQNFADEVEQLKNSQAIIQLSDTHSLKDNLQRLLNNKQERDQLGHAAFTLIKAKQHIAEEYYETLTPVLNSAATNSANES